MILVLNCGSQSIKWKLFKRKSKFALELKKQNKVDVFNVKNYKKILEKELGKIKKEDIKIIGHRFVFGGDKFRDPVIITKKNLEQLRKFNKFAPLHNPFNILGIEMVQKVFKNSKQIAVFDTGFYKDLPKESYIYSLPENIRKKFKRFGFHGISHKFVAEQASKQMKKPFNKLKIITCHLGGGSSITAIKNGKAVDTSMGFSPMEGLMMMTRTGDIDSGIVLELAREFSVKKTNEILNYKSGIKGLCGEDKMLKVLKRKDKKAKLALKIFIYKIKKYIGSYYAILNGCDLLVFTGTIGYGSSKIRNMIYKDLGILKNTKILTIKTNEELEIAKEINK